MTSRPVWPDNRDLDLPEAMNTTFQELSDSELRETAGGSFAYDLGRVIRFLGISGGGMNVGAAMADWYATSVLNQ